MLFFILSIFIVYILYRSALFILAFGNVEIQLSSDEKGIIEKYKSKYRTNNVIARHDYFLIKSNKYHGVFSFTLATDDSLTNFNSISVDSIKKISTNISIDMQKVLNYKKHYDSISDY